MTERREGIFLLCGGHRYRPNMHMEFELNKNGSNLNADWNFSVQFMRQTVLPMFVNNDIRKEMYKGADANVDAQFKKLYIYHMENVSILFADIKVSINFANALLCQ